MNLTEFGYVAAWRLARALPRPVVAALFRAGADRAYRSGGVGVTRLRANLRRVVGPELPEAELDDLVRRGLRSYARYWMEAFRLQDLSREQILAAFRLDGADRLAADVAAGRGAVVAVPHSANWDLAGAWVAANDWPVTSVVERVRPEGLYQRFLALRQRMGLEVLPTRGSERPPFEVLLDRLRAGAVVPLLADRDFSTRGVEVDFFGGRSRMPPGPALLAIRTGAPLYVASMWYEQDAACAALSDPLPVPDPDSGSLDDRVQILTQRIADALAAGIAEHPEDWHMLQRMWLDQSGGGDGGPPAPTPPAGTGTA